MSRIDLWWWRWRHPAELNFGDELTAPLLERLTGRPVRWTPLEEAAVVGAGSVLQKFLKARPDDMPLVWGSGLISPPSSPLPAGFAPLAVRGRKTAAHLAPEARDQVALGDPGLLADRLVDGTVSKKYALGVVPHYKDAQDPLVATLTDLGPSVRRIDVAWTPEEVAREIAACEVVVSSSMHGLIFADALGVPNLRVKMSDKLVGGDYKFVDYCSAFETERYQPPLRPSDLRSSSLDQVAALVTDRYVPPVGLEGLQAGLVESLPI